MFKHALVLVSCFAVIASTAAVAQPAYHGSQRNHPYVQKKVVHAPTRGHQFRQHEARRHVWTKGHRVSDWRGRSQVRDYHRYGLRTPGRGQAWVKVDNNYLLLSMATGIIAAVAAAR